MDQDQEQDKVKETKAFAGRRPELEAWLRSPLGREVLEIERGMMDQVLPRLFGYRLMQIGVSPHLPLYHASTAGHRFVAYPVPEPDLNDGLLCAEPAALALDTESVDIVLLHHVLDFDANPHQVLREAARVTISGGTLVIVGFNPWSLFGFRRVFGRRPVPWSGGFISPPRLGDWMTLLDLHPERAAYGFFRPPLQHAGLLGSMRWLEQPGRKLNLPVGGVYVLVARKQPVGMTPLRPSWKKKPAIAVTGIKPTFGESLFDTDR